MNNPNALAPLPWRLAYPGASTVEDARGRTVAECPTPAVAAALVAMVNRPWLEEMLTKLAAIEKELAAREAELRRQLEGK